MKKKTEGWADLAEELRVLVDRAYPTLQAKGREQLALNHFLGQLENPQVAFSVKQKHPKTLEEAVTATLEMESYLGPKAAGTAGIAGVITEDSGEDMPVAAVAGTELITRQLLTRMDRIKREVATSQIKEPTLQQSGDGGSPPGGKHAKSGQQPLVCWNCGKKGHISRECRTRRTQPQGN